MFQWFTYLLIVSAILLLSGSLLAFFTNHRKWVHLSMFVYFILWTVWIVYMWFSLGRAPFKTVGETRVWYIYLVPAIAWGMYWQHRLKWIVGYGSLIAMVFMLLNWLHPENFSKELMPALQSVWFAPHVLVYMFAYALFGVATSIAVHYLLFRKIQDWQEFNLLTKRLIYSGFAFLTLGLLFGAIWAKQAWGHYWTWDPKEVWALATWLLYMLYIHILYMKNVGKWSAYVLIASFIVLLLCWFGVNYLPIAQYSVHTY